MLTKLNSIWIKILAGFEGFLCFCFFEGRSRIIFSSIFSLHYFWKGKIFKSLSTSMKIMLYPGTLWEVTARPASSPGCDKPAAWGARADRRLRNRLCTGGPRTWLRRTTGPVGKHKSLSKRNWNSQEADRLTLTKINAGHRSTPSLKSNPDGSNS